MPKFNGQTDSPLQIKLKSEIVEARWGTSQVAQGGRVQIEVTTGFVADGATVKIAIKDKEGAAVDAVTGKIYGNLYRGFYVLSKPNKTGAMTFEAELPDHAAKGKAGWIKVLPPIKITELKLQDGDGKDLLEIAQEPILKMLGKVEGPPDGTQCDFVLYCRIKDQAPQPVFTGKGILTSGQVSCQWKRKPPQQEQYSPTQAELDKFGENYQAPFYFFELCCLGVSGTSPKLSSKQVDSEIISAETAVPANMPWMIVAENEAKRWKGAPETEISKTINYHKEVGIALADQSGTAHAWCASFVNYCLKQSGFEMALPAYQARSFLVDRNFVLLEKPVFGAIALIGSRHVCFVYAQDNKTGRPILLGGNQSDQINFAMFNEKITYFLPKRAQAFINDSHELAFASIVDLNTTFGILSHKQAGNGTR